MKVPTHTLEELTQAFFALRQELTQAVTEQGTALCPQERIVETLVGAVRLRRPYF